MNQGPSIRRDCELHRVEENCLNASRVFQLSLANRFGISTHVGSGD
jgi:hypothetical protein